MFTYIRLAFLSVCLPFLIISSYAFESYEEVQQYENTIFTQGENFLSDYNSIHNTDFTFSDIESLPTILENLVTEGKEQEAGLLNEYFRLKNRTPISQLSTPIVEDDIMTQNQYNPLYNQYQRGLAVSYAYQWIQKPRNPAYNYYEQFGWANNGQNFVSQVLYAGWMPHVCWKNNTNVTDKNCWYYENTWYAKPTHTWGGAHNFYEHAKANPLKYVKMDYPHQLDVGDIIQIDFGNTEHIDQTMVVTKKTGHADSQIFLSYSKEYSSPGNDVKDRSLQQIKNMSGYAKYYYWRINY